MFSRRVLCSCARHATSISRRAYSLQRISPNTTLSSVRSPLLRAPNTRPIPVPFRAYASQTTADEKIDEIQELYATAKDEFEIAAEETEKMTVYAEDDRAAAREELTKLQTVYKAVVEGQDTQLAEEVKRRVGQRIRELENAVEAMEEMAMNQD